VRGCLQLGDIGGELVDALPHHSETARYRYELIGRSASGRGRRCQPAKVWGPASDRLSGCAAVGLPRQGGNNTSEKDHQEADEGKWN